MIKILVGIQEQIVAALNAVEAPNFVGTPIDDDMRGHLWTTAGAYDGEQILAHRYGRSARFLLGVDGKVRIVGCEPLDRDDLFAVHAYMRACEEAVDRLNDGQVLVQARDVDTALQAANPDFRKTDAFRRLDDALN